MYQTAGTAAKMHIKSDELLHGSIANCRMVYVLHQIKLTTYIGTLALNYYKTDCAIDIAITIA